MSHESFSFASTSLNPIKNMLEERSLELQDMIQLMQWQLMLLLQLSLILICLSWKKRKFAIQFSNTRKVVNGSSSIQKPNSKRFIGTNEFGNTESIIIRSIAIISDTNTIQRLLETLLAFKILLAISIL